MWEFRIVQLDRGAAEPKPPARQRYHRRCLVLQNSQLLVSFILFRGLNEPIPFSNPGRFEPTF